MKLALAVAGESADVGAAVFQVWLAHHPGDINQDGIVDVRDATVFGELFRGGGSPLLVDLNVDGAVDVRDATRFGDLWNGRGDASQPWNDLGRTGGKAEANCPRCHAAMTRGHDDADTSLVIDMCPECGGVWYDGGEVAKHLEAIRDEGIIGYFKRMLRTRG